MKNCCGTLLRITLVAFLALRAYNNLKDTKVSSQNLMNKYKTFQDTVVKRTNIQMPEQIAHKNIHHHGECIVKYTAWATFILGALCILLCPKFTALLGLLYLLEQMVHLNVAKLSTETAFEEMQEIALTLFIVLSCFQLACGSSSCKTACPMTKNTNSNQKSKRKKH